MMIGTYAVIFGVGSVFIDQGVLTFQDLLQALFGIIFAAMGMFVMPSNAGARTMP
jgi:hypothetical protein